LYGSFKKELVLVVEINISRMYISLLKIRKVKASSNKKKKDCPETGTILKLSKSRFSE
jgi:hypothetical protein